MIQREIDLNKIEATNALPRESTKANKQISRHAKIQRYKDKMSHTSQVCLRFSLEISGQLLKLLSSKQC